MVVWQTENTAGTAATRRLLRLRVLYVLVLFDFPVAIWMIRFARAAMSASCVTSTMVFLAATALKSP